MTRTQVAKQRHLRRGFSLQEEAPPEEPMEYEEEDDLADLLGEEEEPMAPPEEDSGLALAQELESLYKALDDRDAMTVQLAKAVRTLAKRVIALEDDDDDESDDDKEDKAEGAERKVELEAPEADMPVGGTQDLGEDVQQGGEAMEPGLTAGQPQGIAQKAKIATALEKANVHPDIIAKTTGLIRKDDKWSNFGEKDSDIPANAPVTPDTKDWDEDFEIVPGSGQAPASVKGIGSVHKALTDRGVDAAVVDKMFADQGIIRKARPVTIGGLNPSEPQTVDNLEEAARGMTFGALNHMRVDMGDL